MVAISVDSAQDSAELIEDKKLTLPILGDPQMTAIDAYGVAMVGKDIAVPTTLVIRQDGTIAWEYVGENMTDRPTSADLIDLAVAEK